MTPPPDDAVGTYLDVLRGIGLPDAEISTLHDGPESGESVERQVALHLDGAGPDRLFDRLHDALARSSRGIDATMRFWNHVPGVQLERVLRPYGYEVSVSAAGAGSTGPFSIEVTDLTSGDDRQTAFAYPDGRLGEHNYPALVDAVERLVEDALTLRLLSERENRWRFVLVEQSNLSALQSRHGDRIEVFGRPLLAVHQPPDFANGTPAEAGWSVPERPRNSEAEDPAGGPESDDDPSETGARPENGDQQSGDAGPSVTESDPERSTAVGGGWLARGVASEGGMDAVVDALSESGPRRTTSERTADDVLAEADPDPDEKRGDDERLATGPESDDETPGDQTADGRDPARQTVDKESASDRPAEGPARADAPTARDTAKPADDSTISDPSGSGPTEVVAERGVDEVFAEIERAARREREDSAPVEERADDRETIVGEGVPAPAEMIATGSDPFEADEAFGSLSGAGPEETVGESVDDVFAAMGDDDSPPTDRDAGETPPERDNVVADAGETPPERDDAVADAGETPPERDDIVADAGDGPTDPSDAVADTTDDSADPADAVADTTDDSADPTEGRTESEDVAVDPDDIVADPDAEPTAAAAEDTPETAAGDPEAEAFFDSLGREMADTTTVEEGDAGPPTDDPHEAASFDTESRSGPEPGSEREADDSGPAVEQTPADADEPTTADADELAGAIDEEGTASGDSADTTSDPADDTWSDIEDADSPFLGRVESDDQPGAPESQTEFDDLADRGEDDPDGYLADVDDEEIDDLIVDAESGGEVDAESAVGTVEDRGDGTATAGGGSSGEGDATADAESDSGVPIREAERPDDRRFDETVGESVLGDTGVDGSGQPREEGSTTGGREDAARIVDVDADDRGAGDETADSDERDGGLLSRVRSFVGGLFGGE